MHTRRTLELDSGAWDLTVDSVGRVKLASGAAATAQNVANEARLFTKDAYFAQERGIPHFAVELGKRGSTAPLRSHLRKAALLVDDVAEVTSVNAEVPEGRKITGDIRFRTAEVEDSELTTYF